MDPLPRPVCSANPVVMCGERRGALRRGEMFYSSHYVGWIYPAEDRHVPRGLTERGQQPNRWSFCPFCGGPLPDVFNAVRDLLDDSGEGPE